MTNRIPMPPPGGELVCAPGQMPKVQTTGGQIFAECCSPPPGTPVGQNGRYTAAFKAWAVTTITGIPRNAIREVSPADEAMLRSGRYEYRTRDGVMAVVEFRLPDTTSTETSEQSSS